MIESDDIETYVRQFGGHTKMWNTGQRLLTSGHVLGVECCTESQLQRQRILRGKCKPTMCSSPPYHEPFAIVEESSESDGVRIVGGSSTCKAGRSQSCVHVAAFLMMASHLTEKRCTSQPCLWIRPSATTSPPSVTFAKDLDHGKVASAKVWTGRLLDLDVLESVFAANDVANSWTAFRE